MPEEQKIFIAVATKVVTPTGLVIEQPYGRQMAQVAHVVSKIRLKYALALFNDSKRELSTTLVEDCLFPQAITTIVLHARDIQELHHLTLLLKAEEIPHETFYDDNDEVYGKGVEIMTALGTHPVNTIDVAGILDYLPLWGSR